MRPERVGTGLVIREKITYSYMTYTHNLALLSSILAIVSRCTSSGPSASRSVLAPANMRAKGWSSHTPKPPCSCIAASMTDSAAFGAATLHAAMAPFAVLLPSLSSRRAASSAVSYTHLTLPTKA